MSDDIVVASTTDDIKDVRLAAGLPAEPPKDEKTEEKQEVITEPAKEPGAEPGKEKEKEKAEDPPKKDESKPASESATEREKENQDKSESGFQKRIDKLTGQKYDLVAENEALKRRLELVERAAPPKKEPAEPKADAKPVLKDFKTPEEFYESLGRWSARQEMAKAAEADDRAATEEELKETYDTYNMATRKFAAEHDDFTEVVGQPIKIPRAVQVAIVELGDSGPAVAYHLGKNPEVCSKLCQMTDARAIFELGRIITKLEPAAGPVKKEEPKVEPATPKKNPPASKAPTPIKPVAAKANTSEVPLDTLDYQEYRRVRDEQTRKVRRR